MKVFRRVTNDQAAQAKDELAAELAQLEQVRAHNPCIHFGAPTRCPACATYGLVERLDPRAGVADNRCPTCTTAWRITRRALRARAQAPRPAVVAPEGDGILFRDVTGHRPTGHAATGHGASGHAFARPDVVAA